MGHDTLLLIFPISNSCQISQTVQQKARFPRNSETKVKDQVIIF